MRIPRYIATVSAKKNAHLLALVAGKFYYGYQRNFILFKTIVIRSLGADVSFSYRTRRFRFNTLVNLLGVFHYFFNL